jgi:FkbM family methyltransferase
VNLRQAAKAALFRFLGPRRAARVLLRKRRPPALRATLHGALLDLQARVPRIAILQVGAYDGESFDPLRSFLREFPCRAVLVEPMRDSFTRLHALYAERPGITLINAAVTADGAPARMHRVSADFAGDRRTLGALTTTRREVLAWHESEFPGLADHIETFEVHGVSPGALLRLFDGGRPDVVVVDTEGFDWAILELLAVERIMPAVVYFEHKHLSAAELRDSVTTLAGAGYELVVSAQDVLATRRG